MRLMTRPRPRKRAPGHEAVVFDPLDVVFHPPWNGGTYDT
jgi:hypothetical protein